MKASNAPAPIAGATSGSVMVNTIFHGRAPRMRAAFSRLPSRVRSAEAVVMKTSGTASRVATKT